MQVKALLFSNRTPHKDPLRSTLELGRSLNLDEEMSTLAPAAYVLERENLSPLRAHKDLIVDRGIKHKAKGLSKLLLGFDKVPLIDGNFSECGQLRRSVRTLLTNALVRGERNLYMIGVEQTIFDELWERAGREIDHKARQPKPASQPIQGKFSEAGDKVISRVLLELMDPCAIPEGLSLAYVGNSIEVQLVRQLILKAATTDNPVLILGDTGTGKGIIAREIHQYSKHRHERFMAVNCAAIPTELLELELFGAEKDAIQKGYPRKVGLWEEVKGGTLFLDEIGDLAMGHQAKILHALEEGIIRRIGGTEDIKVTARIVAATNRDLFSLVRAGRFRDDLYYRLRVFLIRAPSLRDNLTDIPKLTQFFWRKITGDARSTLPEEILSGLQSYGWPGNARELKTLLSSLFALFGKEDLRMEHLRAVQEFEGRLSIHSMTQPSPEEEIRLHRVKCLRHLRGVDEFLHAFRATLIPILEHIKTDGQALTSVQQSLRYQLNELELLCQHPLLFHSELAFSGVYRLKGKLAYFQSLLESSAKEAFLYWKKEVAEELQPILSTIFKEVERILEKV